MIIRRAFVVQKHAARRLHYDFRLELDGMLMSWAVPKGPSLNPSHKRLAVEVDDHALDHQSFEGIIPGSQYGSGAVIIWDRGTWTSLDLDPREAMTTKGRLKFELFGEKLRGAFVLLRTKPSATSASKKIVSAKLKNWLLIKRRDDWADPKSDGQDAPSIVDREPRSVVTGRTIEEVEAEGSTAIDDDGNRFDTKPR